MDNDLVKFLASLLAVVIAAYLGSLLALRRTKRERRWQAKYDAYRHILAAVEDMRFWAEETHAANLCLPAAGGDVMKEAGQQFERAKKDLWGYVHVGRLVISEKATTCLEDLLSKIAHEEFAFEDDAVENSEYPGALAAHCDRLGGIIRPSFAPLLTIARTWPKRQILQPPPNHCLVLTAARGPSRPMKRRLWTPAIAHRFVWFRDGAAGGGALRQQLAVMLPSGILYYEASGRCLSLIWY
jgi:hypothetical protein